ncbi:MAG TPA: hypothetical protein VGN17_14975 [Bryobacteraceae bacterium]
MTLIPFAGIQEDEALYSMPLYLPLGPEFQIRILHHSIPLMLMSYLGTLKTAIYAVVIRLAGSGVWATRLPMALVGAVTIYIFCHLCFAAHRSGALAAGLGAALLATDPSFLLTNTFDWGPVALEHVLLVSACLLLYRFATNSSQIWRLAAAAFLFGLALWNKALFLWALSGVTVGGLLVFWPEVKRLASRRNVTVAAGAFLVGAFPLVLFNLLNRNATLGENVTLDTAHLAQKWRQVQVAANGNALFGFMVANEAPRAVTGAGSVPGRAAVWIHEHLGEHRETGLYYVYGALILAAPLWWRSRAARFSLVFVGVAWLMMALTKDAGQALHHEILLWPFPVLFAAVTLAEIPWRWVGGGIGAVLVVSNLLVVNQYVFQFERNGATGNFTDALFPLAEALPESRPVDAMDFGILVTMELAHEGRLQARFAGDPMRTDSPNPAEQAQMRAMLAEPGALFVDHVPELEQFRGVGANLDRFAAAERYRKVPVRTVADSHGRPTFEIFEYRRM